MMNPTHLSFWIICVVCLPLYVGLMFLLSSCIFIGCLHVISWLYLGLKFVWTWTKKIVCWPFKMSDRILTVGLREYHQKRWHDWYERWSKLPMDKR